MCIADPCQIIEFLNEKKTLALGDFIGIKREINIRLLGPDIKIEDYTIVHVGYTIQKINLEKSQKSIEIFKEYIEFENDLICGDRVGIEVE